MNKHTPTPWHVGETAPTIVYAPDGFAVANATVFHGRHEPEESVTNAAFIVRACNAHDELVSVLGRMLRAHDAGEYVLKEQFADAARAALIKARGCV